jgi:hypothetical protein
MLVVNPRIEICSQKCHNSTLVHLLQKRGDNAPSQRAQYVPQEAPYGAEAPDAHDQPGNSADRDLQLRRAAPDTEWSAHRGGCRPPDRWRLRRLELRLQSEAAMNRDELEETLRWPRLWEKYRKERRIRLERWKMARTAKSKRRRAMRAQRIANKAAHRKRSSH